MKSAFMAFVVVLATAREMPPAMVMRRVALVLVLTLGSSMDPDCRATSAGGSLSTPCRHV